MTRRDDQREAARDHIAQVAAALLVEGGGSAPTTLAVQRAAEISRGALLHHYPTREQLLTAAIATLRAGNAAAVHGALVATHGTDRVEQAVRALAASAVRPEMSAEYGLWAASRTDPDLGEALRNEERGARDALYAVIDRAFGPEIAAHPAYPRIAALTIQFLRGLAITQTLSITDARVEGLVDDWAAVVRLMLASPPIASSHPRDR